MQYIVNIRALKIVTEITFEEAILYDTVTGRREMLINLLF